MDDVPLLPCTLYVYTPGRVEPTIIREPLPKQPSLDDIKRVMLPLIASAKYIEHVFVIHQGKPSDMFVDETGVLRGLPRNEAATAIYRSSWLSRHASTNAETLPHIAGVAVVTGRRIWH